MSIDYNSFSAKLYRYFYHTEDMPTNLCPYFWKLLVAYVLIVPYFLLTLPTKQFNIGNYSRGNIHSEIIAVSFIIWIVFTALLSTVFTLITFTLGYFYMEKELTILGVIQSVGVGVIIVATVGALFLLVERVSDRIREYRYTKKYNKRREEPKANMFVEFVKAKYNNYCPQITWNRTNS